MPEAEKPALTRCVRAGRARLRRRLVGAAVAALLCGLGPAGAADALPKPTGPVILTVSGKIARTNGPGVADFDRALLEELGRARIATETPWTVGMTVFEGAPLAQLMRAVGATGTTARVIALNDYVAAIPLDDFMKYGAVLAFARNGAAMTVREKGPLWIIYPWQDHPELRIETYFARSVWQVRRIVIE